MPKAMFMNRVRLLLLAICIFLASPTYASEREARALYDHYCKVMGKRPTTEEFLKLYNDEDEDDLLDRQALASIATLGAFASQIGPQVFMPPMFGVLSIILRDPSLLGDNMAKALMIQGVSALLQGLVDTGVTGLRGNFYNLPKGRPFLEAITEKELILAAMPYDEVISHTPQIISKVNWKTYIEYPYPGRLVDASWMSYMRMKLLSGVGVAIDLSGTYGTYKAAGFFDITLDSNHLLEISTFSNFQQYMQGALLRKAFQTLSRAARSFLINPRISGKFFYKEGKFYHVYYREKTIDDEFVDHQVTRYPLLHLSILKDTSSYKLGPTVIPPKTWHYWVISKAFPLVGWTGSTVVAFGVRSLMANYLSNMAKGHWTLQVLYFTLSEMLPTALGGAVNEVVQMGWNAFSDRSKPKRSQVPIGTILKNNQFFYVYGIKHVHEK